MRISQRMLFSLFAGLCGLVVTSGAWAQSVCLPQARLLTVVPYGGKAGTTVEVTITGEHLDDAKEMLFSDPRLSATPKLKDSGEVEPNKYVISIAADCPAGVYETRLMTRLGLSSSRIFSVGTLEEVQQAKPNTSLETAMLLPLNSICNASMTPRLIDHYAFEAKQGQRVVIDCATRGIDSKLDATVIVADAQGRDLIVNRSGGAVDFTAPADGRYIVKLHELTFKGGTEYYYRLGVWEQPAGTPIVRQPSTRGVSSFSWPPTGLPGQAAVAEADTADGKAPPQQVTLPLDVAGRFFPAADVDVYEFAAKKGEEWWIEVASERLGRPTDPSVIVQQVIVQDGTETLKDVVQLSDIPSPVKVSSNGYAYDGPPYNAGSPDVLGKVTIPEDGTYRVRVSDLFGGTRSDPENVYRLVMRPAAPDFALVAWALHMELRNGDRNALSKPISLRGGQTMALEVIAIRRDGFDGPIQLTLDGLPEGVTASGLTIPAGQSRGLLLVTANQNAPRGFTSANFLGKAEINGQAVSRPCHLASMTWPVPDAWGEFPVPRLLADVPVSVGGVDFAPLSIAANSAEPFVVKAGQAVKVPLVLTRRSEFSGATLQLKTIGAGFERVPQFDASLNGDTGEATIDTAALKTAPGDYVIAFMGSAVAKYRHHPEKVELAEAAKKTADEALVKADEELKKAMEVASAADATDEVKKELEAATARQKAAAQGVQDAANKLKSATDTAAPRDIVDIVVSEPITIRVQPAE